MGQSADGSIRAVVKTQYLPPQASLSRQVTGKPSNFHVVYTVTMAAYGINVGNKRITHPAKRSRKPLSYAITAMRLSIE